MPKISKSSKERNAAKSIARAWKRNFSEKTTFKLVQNKNSQANITIDLAKQSQ